MLDDERHPDDKRQNDGSDCGDGEQVTVDVAVVRCHVVGPPSEAAARGVASYRLKTGVDAGRRLRAGRRVRRTDDKVRWFTPGQWAREGCGRDCLAAGSAGGTGGHLPKMVPASPRTV